MSGILYLAVKGSVRKGGQYNVKADMVILDHIIGSDRAGIITVCCREPDYNE